MDYSEIKKLIQDVEKSNLDSIEIELPEGTKVKMRKSPIVYAGMMNERLETTSLEKASLENQFTNSKSKLKKDVSTIINKENNEEALEDENYKTIKSPMVGTFYLKSSPKAEPFVKVGDKIKKGDVLCIIEAMKLMNEIESDVDGEIAEICFKDDDLVEYGSVLFKIK